MLTRLRVKGFKNLVDCEARFGPFTCIAGPNGVGKSNLFDAILFLSRLADASLLEAVTGVRGEVRSADALRVFSRWPGGHADEMSFEADLLVPPVAHDDLDQEARATTTALRYRVVIRASVDPGSTIPRLQVAQESLDYLRKGELLAMLPFAKNHTAWVDSVFVGRRNSPFISTEEPGLIRVHEDSGHQGRARSIRAETLQRTVLSSMNTAETPTALIARREMQSWRLLQLEPSKLRSPDEMKARAQLGYDGSGLAATLNRLLASGDPSARDALRSRLVNRLRELNEDVGAIAIDADGKRELLTVMIKARNGVEFRARDLSDGTLRFLALAVLGEDPSWGGVLCMEEPENGVHPSRLEAMRQLVSDLAVDLDFPVGLDNPLRQVILNTHSPQLVGLVHADALVLAARQGSAEGIESLQLRAPAGTWRAQLPGAEFASPGEVIAFLNSLQTALARTDEDDTPGAPTRVARRSDLRQLMLPWQS